MVHDGDDVGEALSGAGGQRVAAVRARAAHTLDVVAVQAELAATLGRGWLVPDFISCST